MSRLIIAPHLDDEVLGCGGIMGPQPNGEHEDDIVLYCGIDESSINQEWVRDRPKTEDRRKELDDVKLFYGFEYEILNQPVNNYQEVELVSHFEKLINNCKPIQVYIPHPSYNQDHRAVYNAAMIALRPHDTNYFVDRVLIYEQPHILWGKEQFRPQYFKPIDIDLKLHAYKLYKSQIRSFRSEDQVKALSVLRGQQSNYKYAEAFEVMRWVS